MKFKSDLFPEQAMDAQFLAAHQRNSLCRPRSSFLFGRGYDGLVLQSPFAQHDLVDLADRGQRQLLDEQDAIGDREFRDDALVDVSAHVGANGLLRGFRRAAREPRLHDDKRHADARPIWRP